MIALADFHARKLLQSWHEGVAITRELIDTLARAGSPEHVPDFTHIGIDTEGNLAFRPDSPPLPGHPVKRLAELLQLLLDGTGAPPELNALAADNLSDLPKHQTVEEFSNALAMFERPGRRSEIARVAARHPGKDAPPVAAPSVIESEISQLRARAQQPRPAGTEPARANPRRKWVVPVTVGGLLILTIYMGLAVALWLKNGQHGPEAAAALKTLVARLESRLTELVGGVEKVDSLKSVSLLHDDTPKPEATTASAETPAGKSTGSTSTGTKSVQPKPTARARAARATTARAPAGRASSARPAAPNSRVARSRTTNRPARTASREDAHVPTGTQPKLEFVPVAKGDGAPGQSAQMELGANEFTDGPVVYTRADSGVRPPVMLHPYLRSVRVTQANSGSGVFDIVVGENGEVEAVQLVSTTYPFHAKMLVAAIKAWKFRPAIKEGQPVKYRVAVRITT